MGVNFFIWWHEMLCGCRDAQRKKTTQSWRPFARSRIHPVRPVMRYVDHVETRMWKTCCTDIHVTSPRRIRQYSHRSRNAQNNGCESGHVISPPKGFRFPRSACPSRRLRFSKDEATQESQGHGKCKNRNCAASTHGSVWTCSIQNLCYPMCCKVALDPIAAPLLAQNWLVAWT